MGLFLVVHRDTVNLHAEQSQTITSQCMVASMKSLLQLLSGAHGGDTLVCVSVRDTAIPGTVWASRVHTSSLVVMACMYTLTLCGLFVFASERDILT